MQKKVFIIIVSYNGAQWIQKNLESLKQSIYPVKTLLIDNNSSDETVSIVKSFPNVQLILLDENLGFGKANNIAIKEALNQEAEYVFLLNQDTWISPKTISNLVMAAEKNKDFGILSPMHFSGDGITLDKNFETYWNRKTNFVSENIDEVSFVNAAAWLIPKAVINKVGFFEPLFNHYGEDRNYSDRVLFHKFKIGIVKDSIIYHDRLIKRHFKKDVIQSKFRVLANILNVNDSLIVGYLKGFRSVLGLPKYFFKFYSFSEVIKLFFILIGYFITLKLNVLKIYKIRASYR
ncbi:glycosyltransferase family 2 protein [Confluentibacter sediminis]|uniref:glycosyltransferase family 2 protein n=1 Tax=Confluentibacter sediminis TaxID=2219045 RepID=UPI000DADBB77|nr:glycosyltransferase family 2 protein [Confluentibacter sediminis]